MVLVYAMVILTEVVALVFTRTHLAGEFLILIYHVLRTAMRDNFGNQCCIACWGYPLTERSGQSMNSFGAFLVGYDQPYRDETVGWKKSVIPKSSFRILL